MSASDGLVEVVGVIGVGSLGAAVATGLLREPGPRIVLSPRGADRAAALAAQSERVTVAEDNQGVVDASDVVLVCLRQRDAGLIADLTWRPEQVVVSAVGGQSAEELRAGVAPAARVARCVPLVAVADHAWATPVHPPLPEVVALLDRIGGAVELTTEEQLDAVITGLGTVAAFFDYLGVVEGYLTDHAVPADDARRMVAQLFVQVVSPMAGGDVPDFDAERRQHATAGGLNEQLVDLLRDAGVPGLTRAGLDELYRRQTQG